MDIKTKTVGGRRRFDREKDAKWREVMSAFSGSGLSVREFCRRHGINEPSFYSWRRMLAQRDGQETETTLAVGRPSRQVGTAAAASQTRAMLSPVMVVPGPVASELSAAMEICIGDELRIHIDGRCPAALLEQVLTTLRGAHCTQAGSRC